MVNIIGYVVSVCENCIFLFTMSFVLCLKINFFVRSEISLVIIPFDIFLLGKNCYCFNQYEDLCLMFLYLKLLINIKYF